MTRTEKHQAVSPKIREEVFGRKLTPATTACLRCCAFFAVAVAFVCYLLPQKDYMLELTVRSQRHAAIVLYMNLGQGFNDDDQSATTLKAQKETGLYRFLLPSGKYKGLRLDFIDVDGPITVGNLRVLGKGGALVRHLPVANFQTSDKITASIEPDTVELTPAQGRATSSVKITFATPFVLDMQYNFLKRTLIALPLCLSAFFLARLILLRVSVAEFGGRTGAILALLHGALDRWAPCLALLFAGMILFARMPDRFLQPQFYAEDGYFYACAIQFGAKALLMPYGGYLLTADRLIAAVAIHLPALEAPLFFNFTALLILLGVLSRIFSSRVELPCRLLLALAVVLIPRPQDIFLTITNIQWVLALALVLLLLSADASRLRQHVYDYAAATLIGLTGVFSVALLPFFVWRALRRRTIPSFALMTIVSVTAAIQVWLVVKTPHAVQDPIESSIFIIPSIIGHRFFCLLFGGPWLVRAWKFILPFFAALVAGWAVVLCRPAKVISVEAYSRWIFLAIACVLTAASLYRYKDMLPLYLSAGYSRYFFIPQLLFTWLIIFELRSSFIRRGLASIALYAFLFTTLCTFRVEPFVDYRWQYYAPLVDQGRDVWLPINPPGWRCYIQEIRK